MLYAEPCSIQGFKASQILSRQGTKGTAQTKRPIPPPLLPPLSVPVPVALTLTLALALTLASAGAMAVDVALTLAVALTWIPCRPWA